MGGAYHMYWAGHLMHKTPPSTCLFKLRQQYITKFTTIRPQLTPYEGKRVVKRSGFGQDPGNYTLPLTRLFNRKG